MSATTFITLAYFNPYYDKDFFGFFVTLLMRLWSFITGQGIGSGIYSDEVQMLVLAGVALSSGIVGSFLVLRKMTMLANALSHTILVGIVLSFVLLGPQAEKEGHLQLNIGMMIFASLLMGVVTTFLTEFLSKTARLQEDASVGVVFTSLFALGIILVTLLTRNVHIGTEVVMGNADSLHVDDIAPVYYIFALNAFVFMLFFKEFKVAAFDPGLARALGISTVFFNYLLMIQVSATAVGAFRAVGVLMVLAFLTGPVLTARLLTHDLKRMITLSSIIGAVSSVLGVALARHFFTVNGIALTTAGITVCVIVGFYLAALGYSFATKKL